MKHSALTHFRFGLNTIRNQIWLITYSRCIWYHSYSQNTIHLSKSFTVWTVLVCAMKTKVRTDIMWYNSAWKLLDTLVFSESKGNKYSFIIMYSLQQQQQHKWMSNAKSTQHVQPTRSYKGRFNSIHNTCCLLELSCLVDSILKMLWQHECIYFMSW